MHREMERCNVWFYAGVDEPYAPTRKNLFFDYYLDILLLPTFQLMLD